MKAGVIAAALAAMAAHCCAATSLSLQPTLNHPGGWHCAADVARVRSKVSTAAQPWTTAYHVLMNDTSLTVDYRPSPVGVVHRDCCDPHPNNTGNLQYERDSIAAYYSMVRWLGTADPDDAKPHALLAMRIIDAWAMTITGFAGHNQMLAAGIYGSHMAQAAELLAYAVPEWPGRPAAEAMFRDVIYPVCSQFCGRTNLGPPLPPQQSCDHGANGNWDTACMSMVASVAVFLDNATMLQSVVDYYNGGRGNGRLTNYIIDPAGQCQESGRDQAHTQDGLEHLLETALTIHHATNSTDPFTRSNYRLLAGLEYTAAYNLNRSVPFTPNCGAYPTSGWCFKTISNQSRGVFSDMWEMAAAVYGEAATFSRAVVGRPGYRPEGAHAPIINDGPHVG
eukprot:CAMPEP_0182930890 /NCGR_PEP_ID=MMETSP0105_2-20130417/26658_1 /TAXON_ID=81532 ORGANISM="Acanthoeca-like sp., Strain 10tr" /NCGR_SAMPLE_ID=MMETSP0105_2 /ASSEMBLY_ACC=CAM_ASM_000205 /LENGTH=392 /DNA_ID=CAMNT_0025069231 /DNA_START=8 /DNA_END=1182 /DNA_ORIENTATION=-